MGWLGGGSSNALGCTRGSIDGRIRRGYLHLVHRGVYAVGHRESAKQGTMDGRGPGGRPGRRIEPPLGRASSGALPPQMRRTARSDATKRMADTLRNRPVPVSVAIDDEVARRSLEFRSRQSLERLLDLAGVLTRRQLERALNEAEVLRLTDQLSVPDLLERYPRRRRVRGPACSASGSHGRTRDHPPRAGASAFRLSSIALDLPRPRLNAHVSVQRTVLRGRLPLDVSSG